MRPAVIPWFKAYSAFLTLLYLAVIVYGAFMASRPAVFEMPEGFGRFFGLALAVLGLAFAIGFGAGLFLPRRPWAWVYGLVLICIGLTGCTLPFSAALLFFWIKPETQAWFGRNVPPPPI
jgi:hypothetical protein